MKEQLTHILDQSVCLSRKQMKEYLSGSMLPEEVHAAEVHISSCPLCSMAMDGFQQHSDSALAAIASLNSGFLKEHFDNIAPQIHLNSMGPSAAINAAARSRVSTGAWIRPAGIAAGLLLVCAAAWYLASRNEQPEVTPDIAQTSVSQPSATPDPAPGNSSAPLVAAQSAAAVSVPQPAEMPKAPAAGAVPGTENAKPGTAPKAAAATAARNSEMHGVARYYQPEPIPVEDPALANKVPETVLPSASDASKTYQGDISVRTVKPYVPPVAESTDASKALTPPAQTRAVPPAKPATELKAPAKRYEESSDQLFERGEYRSALSRYRQQLRSNDPEIRSHASLQAARCYAALGEPDRAEELLRKVMDQGNGRDRRTARKLLRNLR